MIRLISAKDQANIFNFNLLKKYTMFLKGPAESQYSLSFRLKCKCWRNLKKSEWLYLKSSKVNKNIIEDDDF